MDTVRFRLADDVPELRSLGVDDAGELLGPDALPGERATRLEGDEHRSLVRMPLPGTKGDDGRRCGKPLGAGTGWLRLRRYHGGRWPELLSARFTHPRSLSLAERAWNLACHLRAHGVGTPDLVAVGARGSALVARESFLVTRELDGHETLAQWARLDLSPEARRRGVVALGCALANLFRSGVVLPRLDARTIHLSIEPDGPVESCHGPTVAPPNRLPSVVVSALDGGRAHANPPVSWALELLLCLQRELADAGGVGWRARARCLLLALKGTRVPRAERARFWARAGGAAVESVY